jgi:hypothetical protein
LWHETLLFPHQNHEEKLKKTTWSQNLRYYYCLIKVSNVSRKWLIATGKNDPNICFLGKFPPGSKHSKRSPAAKDSQVARWRSQAPSASARPPWQWGSLGVESNHRW